MDCRELQIGDWVRYQHEEGLYDGKITYIGNGEVGVKNNDEYYLEGGIDGDIKDIEPILLTEDKLIQNGFRESIEDGTYYFPIGCESVTEKGYAVETEGDGVWFITEHNLMPFRYVHEFQHILRMCGMNEIADNFITK